MNKTYRLLGSDWDGTWTPSEGLKQSAYTLTFSEYSEDVPFEEIEAAKRKFAGGKGTRYDVFGEIFTRLGFQADKIPVMVAEYAKRYDVVVRNGIVKLGVSDRDRETLRLLSHKVPHYLISITPEQSLISTVSELGVENFFKSVLGAPTTKVENIKKVATLEKCDPKDVLFVGDGSGDFDAARKFGCDFIGYATDYNKWVETGQPFPLITDLRKLLDYF